MVSRIMTYDSKLSVSDPSAHPASAQSSVLPAAESRICPFRCNFCKRLGRPFGIQGLLGYGVPTGGAEI